jgi:hypothetical protein
MLSVNAKLRHNLWICGLIFAGGSSYRPHGHDHVCSLLSDGSGECSLSSVHQFRWFSFILELQPPQSWEIYVPVSALHSGYRKFRKRYATDCWDLTIEPFQKQPGFSPVKYNVCLQH